MSSAMVLPGLLPRPSAAPRRGLLTTTLLVVGVHAVLLLGLPRLVQSLQAPGARVDTLLTRVVTVPAPTPSVAPEPTPGAAPPAAPPDTTAAAPRPRATRPRAAPRVAPEQAPPDTAPVSPAAAQGAAPTGTLLAPRPVGDLGGGSIPRQITPSLDDTAATALVAQLQGEASAPVRVPPAAHLAYEVDIRTSDRAERGVSYLTWRQDGRFYDAQWTYFHLQLGDNSTRSTGIVTLHGLAPLDTRISQATPRNIRFDYDGHLLHYANPEESLPLSSGMQDRLSVLIQLSAMLAADPTRYPPGTAVTLPVATGSAAGDQTFTVEEEESFEALRNQNVRALRLVQRPRNDQDPRTEVWLSPDMEYLPVRIRVTHPNGDVADHRVVRAQALNVEPAARSVR